MVTNLLVNARDAAVSADHGEGSKTVHVSTWREGDLIRIQVQDNGPGLSADLRERIFDPFFTTKEVGQGSGLGLAIVRTLLERHGGTIEVSSEEGEGATFEVTVPAADDVASVT